MTMEICWGNGGETPQENAMKIEDLWVENQGFLGHPDRPIYRALSIDSIESIGFGANHCESGIGYFECRLKRGLLFSQAIQHHFGITHPKGQETEKPGQLCKSEASQKNP